METVWIDRKDGGREGRIAPDCFQCIAFVGRFLFFLRKREKRKLTKVTFEPL